MTTQMDQIHLMITSGDGPEECRFAVGRVLETMILEAEQENLEIETLILGLSKLGNPVSVHMSIYGCGHERFARKWFGTIRWIAKSPFRPNHRRSNWYVGVFRLDHKQSETTNLRPEDVRYETFRAGGPGGQHQNTTDSAVRAIHTPSQLSVVVRDQRSQHRNKQVAVRRLAEQLAIQESLTLARSKRDENLMHKQLERGNPVRTFKGKQFAELR